MELLLQLTRELTGDGISPAPASLKRSAALPDIPTIAESGVPGFSADAILSMLAPAKTPRPIIDMLNAEVHKAMRSSEMVAAMKKVGVDQRKHSLRLDVRLYGEHVGEHQGRVPADHGNECRTCTFATISEPMMPLAPGRLSTMIGDLSDSDITTGQAW